MKRTLVLMIFTAALLLSGFATVSVARAAHTGLSGIAPAKIVLFYPGVASWEFLNSNDHRLGSRAIKRKKKKGCRNCHLSKDGELDLKADEIAAGAIRMKRSHKPFEPEPVPGKAGTMTARVRAGFDNKFLYIMIEWDSDGHGWKLGKTQRGAPDRVSVQLNKRERGFKRFGCFISCHNDLNTMPASPSRNKVGENPYYSKLGRKDVRLYAYYARQSWSRARPEAELKKRLARGGRIDLLTMKLRSGKGVERDGWIFDDRRWEDKAGRAGNAKWADGVYTVVFKRRLGSTDPLDIHIKRGDVFNVGLAIHKDGATKRKHYVSFPFTVGIGTRADVKAVRIAD